MTPKSETTNRKSRATIRKLVSQQKPISDFAGLLKKFVESPNLLEEEIRTYLTKAFDSDDDLIDAIIRRG